MKKTLRMMLLGGAVVLFLSNASCADRTSGIALANPIQPVDESNNHNPITPKNNANRALVYMGPGACVEDCAQAAADMALRSGLDPTFVGPNELNSMTNETDRASLFRDVAIWIQPGGKSRTVLQSMTSQMVTALRSFVEGGGGYVGFCAGAFSSTQMVGTTRYLGYNLMPGKTILFRNDRGAEMLDLTWNGRRRSVYWEGGPYITEIPAGKAEAIATYPSGQIASARSTFGHGRVFVTGAHPEAPQYWRDDYAMEDPDGLDFDLAQEMINWAIKRTE